MSNFPHRFSTDPIIDQVSGEFQLRERLSLSTESMGTINTIARLVIKADDTEECSFDLSPEVAVCLVRRLIDIIDGSQYSGPGVHTLSTYDMTASYFDGSPITDEARNGFSDCKEPDGSLLQNILYPEM